MGKHKSETFLNKIKNIFLPQNWLINKLNVQKKKHSLIVQQLKREYVARDYDTWGIKKRRRALAPVSLMHGHVCVLPHQRERECPHTHTQDLFSANSAAKKKAHLFYRRVLFFPTFLLIVFHPLKLLDNFVSNKVICISHETKQKKN